jgi:hypothetical protein
MAVSGERYVVDASGRRVAVLLDIEEYERLLATLGERASSPIDDAAKSTTGDVVAGLGIVHHPRSPDASPDQLREVMGVVSLEAPVQPRSWRLLDDDEDGVQPTDSDARH